MSANVIEMSYYTYDISMTFSDVITSDAPIIIDNNNCIA